MKPWERSLAPTSDRKPYPWERGFVPPQAQGPEADESAFTVAPQRSRTFIKGEPQNNVVNQKQVRLASEGVAFDSPGDGPLTMEDYQNISLYSAGPEYARQYIGKKVKEKYAPNSPYSTSDLTRIVDGKVQYLDLGKPTPRWTEVDTNLLYSFGEPALWGEMATGVLATTAGAATGGLASPLGGAAGAAAGEGANAYMWRKHNLNKGIELGINEGMLPEDVERLARSSGLLGAGMSAGFASIGGISRGNLSNSLFKRGTASGITDDFERNTAAANAVVEGINREGRAAGLDEVFDPTPAQRAGIREVKDIEATLEAGHAARATQKVSVELKNRKAKDQRVLFQLWDSLFPKSERSIADVEDIGTGIRQHALDAVGNSPEARALRQASAARAGVQQEVNTIDDVVDYEALLNDIRGNPSPNGHISGTKFYDTRDKLATIQNDLVQEVQQRGSNATVEISEKNLMLPRLLELRKSLTSGVPSLDVSSGNAKVAAHIDGILQLVAKNGGEVPFNEVDRVHGLIGSLISDLKGAPGRRADDENVAHLSNLAATLEEAIVKSTRTTSPGGDRTRIPANDLISVWRDRKKVTTLMHDIFDSKVVRQALANEEPDGPTARRIFAELMSPETNKYLGSLVQIVKDDPEAMGALRKAALYQYKKAVYRNGEVNLEAHNRWVNQHKQQLDMLFPDGTQRPWAKVGVLQEAVLSAEKRAKTLDEVHRKAWYQIYGPKYPYNSYTLVKKITSGGASEADADFLIKHLERTDPQLLNLVRQEAKSELRIRLGATKLPTQDSLAKFAKSKQGRNFARIMGPEGEGYLRNLQLLSDAITMTSTEGASLGQPSANLLTSTTRAVAGPLSRIQRFITAGKQIYNWMDAEAAYEIISDPVKLRTTLQYAAMAPSQKAVPATIMANIGALGYLFNKPEAKKK